MNLVAPNDFTVPKLIQHAHILIVDCDAEMRQIMREAMEDHCLLVEEAANREETLLSLQSRKIDLVLLDLNLRAEDGSDLALEIVRRHKIPLIIVSSRSDVFDLVVGLELGADDYIRKPFHVRELVARVRALLRRSRGRAEPSTVPVECDGSEQYAMSGVILDHGMREVRRSDGRDIDLTSYEYNLMYLFMTRPKRVLSRNEIMDALKGSDWSPTDRSIDVLVAKLRKKLDTPGRPSLIKTVRGAGYIFGAEVRRQ